MNLKVTIICLACLAVVGFGLWITINRVTAQAGTSPTVAIAVCDPHKAFMGYQKTMTLRKDLSDEGARIKKQIDDSEKERQAKATELTGGNFTAGSPEYETRRLDLLKKTIEADTFAKVSDNELRRKDMMITEDGYQDVYKAIEKVAKKKNLLLVLSRDDFPLESQRVEELLSKIYYRKPVLYAIDAIDITDEVTQQLNTDYRLGR